MAADLVAEPLAALVAEPGGPVVAAVESTTVSLDASPDLAVSGARGSHATSTFALVRVTTTDGVAGHGEVSATPIWSGEDAATATHMIRTQLAPLLIGQSLVSVPALTRRLDSALAGNPFTKAGVNMALWDALGRTLGVRVVDLLGGPCRASVPVKMSLSGDGDALRRCFEAVAQRGFRSYKVKVGLDVDRDVRRVALARELAGQEAFVGVDANGGWSRLEALAAIPHLRDLGVAFVEQPVEADDLDGLRGCRGYGIPVLADESVFSPGDAARLVRADAADAVSVYVGKSGALERALQTVRMLDLFGIGAVIGSNGEMGLGAAAQIHVACACDRLAPIPSDIIGHHYYDRDTLVEPLSIDGREAHLPTAPGLGVELAPDIVRNFK
jgi:L-alanine-DL-glutamate epimerase-like enolase superfamily enzyme